MEYLGETVMYYKILEPVTYLGRMIIKELKSVAYLVRTVNIEYAILRYIL